MTIAFFFHVGYLVAWDDYGIAVGWGVPKQPVQHGGKRYRFYTEATFPWWVQPSKVRHLFEIERLRRKQARYEKKMSRTHG